MNSHFVKNAPASHDITFYASIPVATAYAQSGFIVISQIFLRQAQGLIELDKVF